VQRLPIEAVRDLLGICRALYAAKKREGAPLPLLDELAVVGEKLKQALELGQKTQPDTLGHRAAWAHAEEATARLMKLVTLSLPLAPTVEAAVIRVRRQTVGPSPRDERKLMHKRRS
jgi:hypothetical protein